MIVMGKSNFKLFIQRKILKNRVTSEELLDNLRKHGADIGKDVLVYSTNRTMIDASSPFLLKIGDHVRIAEGVKILTHDYAWSVLKRYSSDTACEGRIFGAQSAVEIGSNVFIGMNAIITRGVKIGDNVIIGAGSVVTKDCQAGGVYAGNPAKRIMTVEEYYRKREALQLKEAKDIAIRYKQRFHREPPIEIFSEYFMLFTTREEAQKVPAFRAQMGRMGNMEATENYMDTHEPSFPDYEAFLKHCYQQEEV